VRALLPVTVIFGFWATVATGQQPGSRFVPPSEENWGTCCGYHYNYLAVCVFADMVAGNALPALDDRFFRRNPQLRKLSEHLPTSKPTFFWDKYEFQGNGVAGTILRRGLRAFFEDFRVDGRMIPAPLRLKSNLLGHLALRGSGADTDEVESGCEQWSVRLHFTGDTLDWAEFHDARRSYD
jgi:hypothetical protein